jgi:predicted ATPase/DNA-binding SARP family transcriptional activator
VDVRILGPLEVREGSEQLVVASPRQRSILALLAINAPDVVSVDRIVDELWGENPPESAQSTVRYHISKLRSALGEAAACVVTRSPGYVLEVAPEAIDAHRFGSKAAEGRALIVAEPERAARVLVDALSMWRGAPLADFTYESFARTEIVRLEELRLAVVEDRIEADLAAGRHVDLVGELEGLVGEYPLRERLWVQLMTALYRSGRQAEALRAYQQAREALGEIGIEPSEELRAVEEQVLLQDPVLQAVRQPVRRHNLPERVSSFIGREWEIREVGQLVRTHRLVTLTGIGGVGKTSLAVEAVRPLVDGLADGVWLVPVSDVVAAEFIAQRLADVVGVQVETTAGLVDKLGRCLAKREMLLVFDACERHVDAVADLVEALLAAAPFLRVLATSREPFEIAGEARFAVPVLDSDGVDTDAVRLLCDRATLVQPEFDTSMVATGTVAHVCRRLAGIPLAIELAAARLGSLSLQQIADRLDDQMALLARGRRRGKSHHDSLQATFDWSHDLLETFEQMLFRRLAVFEGGFTAEAAEKVCSDETLAKDEVADLLARLVDVSLVVVDRDAARFHMLDPVKQYAEHHLTTTEEATSIRWRHADYYRNLAWEAHANLWGPDEVEWMAILSQEDSNHISAATWALRNGDSRLAVDIAAYLSEFWGDTGREAAKALLIDSALAEAEQHPSRQLVLLISYAGISKSLRGDHKEAIRLVEHALDIARGLGDEYSIGFALGRLGAALGNRRTGDDRALGYTRQAIKVLRRLQHPALVKELFNLVLTLCRRADASGRMLAEADERVQEMLNLAEQICSQRGRAFAYQALAEVQWYRGNLRQARHALENAVATNLTLHRHRHMIGGMGDLALIELELGNIDRAKAYAAEFDSHRGDLWNNRNLIVKGATQLASAETFDDGLATLLEALRLEADRDLWEFSRILVYLARVCTLDDTTTAIRLYAAADSMRSNENLATPAHHREQVNEHLACLRGVLGDEEFERAWTEGAALRIAEVVTVAREALGSPNSEKLDVYPRSARS